MTDVTHENERVELAFKILELRHKIRRTDESAKEVETLRAQMEFLEQRLREIDE